MEYFARAATIAAATALALGTAAGPAMADKPKQVGAPGLCHHFPTATNSPHGDHGSYVISQLDNRCLQLRP